MDNEMIERVAKELQASMPGLVHPEAWPWITMAKAAIKAMREPTEKMKTLVTDEIVITDKCYYCGGHIEGWRAMIDAVISDA